MDRPTLIVLAVSAVLIVVGFWIVDKIMKRLGPKESIEDTDFFRNE